MRLQISLRVFLLGAVLSGIVLAYFVDQFALRPARQQRLAVTLAKWERNDPRLLPEGDLLVLAKTMSVVPDGDYRKASLRIERVYNGPAGLVGHTFDLRYPKNGPRGFMRFPYRLPDKGHQAIWLLDSVDGKLYRVERKTVFSFPVDETADQYAAATRFAVALERVAQLGDRARDQELRDLVGSDTGEIAEWAVKTLQSRRPEGIELFLRESVVDDRLTLRAEIAIDESLLDMQVKGWRGSPVRHELLRSWAAGRKKQVYLVAYWLSSLLRQDDPFLAGAELVDLVQTALKNDALELHDRQRFVALLPAAVARNRADSDARSLWMRLIASAPEKELRVFAADLTAHASFRADETHRAELEKLLSRIDEPEVRQALVRALAERN